MALHPSGSPEEVDLIVIETKELTCVIKGSAAHPQYNKLRKHLSFSIEDVMQFNYRAENLIEIEVYNALTEELEPYRNQSLLPVFFENGRYEIVIIPKGSELLSFYHEFPKFRDAIKRISRSNILTGILHFQNEVGLSSFEIQGEGQEVLLSVVFEVFPTKLDYKKDYKALLNEVNEEVYNLAYHFIKRTYLQGSALIYKDPSLTEFYRLIDMHFKQYMRSIEQIERLSHQQLIKNYKEVRGDRLKQQDSMTKAYLRKNANKFIDVPNGISINDRSIMPQKGLLIQKEHTSNTNENRYVKWTMNRMLTRLKDLRRKIEKSFKKGYGSADDKLVDKLDTMIGWLERRVRNKFWRSIENLDRSIMSLVLQMAPGYRNVLQIYTTISKSIVLTGEVYKMSVKDIATLYEYWTFLKLGSILSQKCNRVSQNIVVFNASGLFVRLDKAQTAEQRFQHPVTKEEITLKYQYDTTNNRLPTVQQKPDTMLSIGKKGRTYQYQYIFDAKYRLDLVTNPDHPGPMQDDINTMHRYRDSIVVNTDGRYERTAFGAYVLFPWHNQHDYQSHPLYKSIDHVNIGGFPFLPNSTELVELFIDNLLIKSPEQLQEEGILPKGAHLEQMPFYTVDKVLIIAAQDLNQLQQLLGSDSYSMHKEKSPESWRRTQHIAIYEKHSGCINHYAKIHEIDLSREDLIFKIGHWKQRSIKGEGYKIQKPMMVNENSFFKAEKLADLYTKSREEEILWKIIQRVSNSPIIELNSFFINKAERISAFKFGSFTLEIFPQKRQLRFTGEDFEEDINMDLILDNESYIFERLTKLIYPYNK